MALRLASLPEPADLRRRLVDLFGEQPSAARPEAVRLVAQRLWRKWRPDLEPHGGSAAAVRAACASGEREIWLWVVGDRAWSHVVDGLAGRVLRRI